MTLSAPDYEISTDPNRLDLDWIHERLSTDTYWAPGRPKERVAQALQRSHCYGVYAPDGPQVGFARLVTDYTVVAWLGDVYLERRVRGIGLAKLLMDRIMADAKQWRLRRVVLSTADAVGLYRKYGFVDMAEDDDDWLQVVWPENL
jgi:GNAT superfamily N-acetyltransferase